jgi:uncharacterized protein (DUF2235 family)
MQTSRIPIPSSLTRPETIGKLLIYMFSGMQNGSLAIPSNVTRIARAIKSETRDGIQQIVYYQEGIGSEGLPINRFVAGMHPAFPW